MTYEKKEFLSSSELLDQHFMDLLSRLHSATCDLLAITEAIDFQLEMTALPLAA